MGDTHGILGSRVPFVFEGGMPLLMLGLVELVRVGRDGSRLDSLQWGVIIIDG